ncbi:MAG TPA: hypothetical protein VFS19_01530 [Planctomycetota bacterium]|nr:hypothetical protein [Planctomycetota bacterium]
MTLQANSDNMAPMSPPTSAPVPQARLRWILMAVGLTLLFETLTLVLRVGGGLESRVATAGLAAFTFGLRIHHGYLGLAMLLAFPLARRWAPAHADRWSATGLALVLSDALHHFGALWVLNGSPGFDLTYGC